MKTLYDVPYLNNDTIFSKTMTLVENAVLLTRITFYTHKIFTALEDGFH
jgi:hypothetical protein